MFKQKDIYEAIIMNYILFLRDRQCLLYVPITFFWFIFLFEILFYYTISHTISHAF